MVDVRDADVVDPCAPDPLSPFLPSDGHKEGFNTLPMMQVTAGSNFANLEWLVPDWPAPPWVRAVSTTRRGGVSVGSHAGFNLGDHVGDDPVRVLANRQLLRSALGLPADPLWLRQVHGCAVACAEAGPELGTSAESSAGGASALAAGEPLGEASRGAPGVASAGVITLGAPKGVEREAPVEARGGTPGEGTEEPPGEGGCEADASVAYGPGAVCAVLTADCLPLLLTDRAGTRVAAVHAGWRGLVAGVIEATVARLAVPPGDLLVWLGPAIGATAFEVGGEVRARFVAADAQAAAAFTPLFGDKWLADIYLLARQRLAALGVARVWGGEHCTYQDRERFYSYRRDGVTGRMASLIWLEASESSPPVPLGPPEPPQIP